MPRYPLPFRLLATFSLAAVLAITGNTASANDLACGALTSSFGPFDYRTIPPEPKHLVEIGHFTSDVESLRRGTTARLPGGDLDYTLRAIPNHHRALMALSRYSVQRKSPRPPGMSWTIDCYFDRAMRWAPDDAFPPLLFGLHLLRTGRHDDARVQLERAEALGKELQDANLYYNLGLGYLDLKDHDKALHFAKRAYAAGFPLLGLRQRLEKEGAWKD
jgi:tetratricopeptide (TPR) repeat protein